jgi:vacuolar protein sorting-associated protein 13A/C
VIQLIDAVSLENNDQPFALLALTAADVAIMLRSGTMRVGARLGNLTLEDVTADQVANPAFKKLLAIEGSELADFSYETYDATDEETFPGYNSAVRLRTGSLKFTFMETPVRNLYAWALKFARLKAVYDAASQAAANRAAEVTRMHYDIVVKTPIVMLPRDGTTSEDALVFRLGEISAKNEYLADIGDTTVIDAGLRGINVTSDLFVDGTKTTLTMVDDVAITASVHQVAKRTDKHKADTVVKTDMTDVKMSLTQRQYALLMSVLQSLPRALSDASEAAKVESGATTPVSEASSSDDNETSVDLRPELSVSERIKGNSDLWTSLDVQFAVTSIALEVFTEAAITLEDQKQHSIARFALVDTTLSMKQLNDGAMEAEFGLKTISFSSTRSGKSAFRDIIPAVTHGGKQIMMQYTKSGGPNGTALAIATIDSPKIVLSVDPLAALLEFAVSPFKKDESDAQPPQEEESVDLTIPETDEVSPKQASLSFRIEVIQSTILVLADDTDPKSQAIQLHVKEILLSQQSIMALKVDQLSMSFGRMDKMHDRVSFLDRLNIALSLETRQRGTEKLTSFDIDIPDPIIFRASYSDIMLIVDIVNKATAAATKAMSGGKEQGAVEDSKADRRTSVGGASSIAPRPSSTAVTRSKNRKSSISTRRRSTQGAKVIVSKEQVRNS